MKLGMIGCLAGSTAAVLFGGCATDEYAATADSPRDTYRGAYRTAWTTDRDEERFAVQASEPIFVEQRRVVVDNQARMVPVYRSGNQYFYTYGGRRYMTTGDVTTRGATGRRALSSAAYSAALQEERPLVRTGYTED